MAFFTHSFTTHPFSPGLATLSCPLSTASITCFTASLYWLSCTKDLSFHAANIKSWGIFQFWAKVQYFSFVYFCRMQKLLIIQTAFIGDVVLATGLLDCMHETYPQAQLDVLVRNGNESLFTNHPVVNQVLVWQKKQSKYSNLMKLAFSVRKASYDMVINLQRYAATGWITCFSGAREKIGFDKNPFRFCYTRTIVHRMDAEKGIHEINRNFKLIEHIKGMQLKKPVLYPSQPDLDKVSQYQRERSEE